MPNTNLGIEISHRFHPVPHFLVHRCADDRCATSRDAGSESARTAAAALRGEIYESQGLGPQKTSQDPWLFLEIWRFPKCIRMPLAVDGQM